MEGNEHELFVQSTVGLYMDDNKLANYNSGRVYLTNERIVYVSDNTKSTSISLKVVSIDDVEFYNGFLKSSPKVTIKVKPAGSCEGITKKQNIVLAWVCTICYFTNDLKTSNYELERMREDCNVLPVCDNCGVKASWSSLESVLKDKVSTVDVDLVSYDGTYCPDCTFLNHPTMLNCEICGAILKKAQDTKSGKDSVEFILESSKHLDYLNINTFKLSFRNGGAKAFYKALQETIKSALWELVEDSNGVNRNAVMVHKDEYDASANQLNVPSKTKPVSNLRGIHGLTTLSEKNNNDASVLLNSSIQDLKQLMSKAEQLISFSQKYNITLEKNHIEPSAADNSLSKILESQAKITKLSNLLQGQQALKTGIDFKKKNSLAALKSVGKATETKSRLPQLYLEELSRHLSEFLTSFNILDRSEGLITLQELFLLYNKTRKVNLISPEELYDAVSLFKPLKLNFTVTDVPLHQDEKASHSKDRIVIISNKSQSISITDKILSFVREHPGKSILELQNTSFNMSYMILKTILDKLVYTSELVIDSTIEGILYWPNEILKPSGMLETPALATQSVDNLKIQ